VQWLALCNKDRCQGSCGSHGFDVVWFVLLLVCGDPCVLQEPHYPSGLSYDAVSFMMQALEKSPQKRPTVAQLLAHPWFDSLAKQQTHSQQQEVQALL